ncbi:MAG: carbamoyltransferase N-terminal domain-containing protein [Acidimicrobiales bacterium]
MTVLGIGAYFHDSAAALVAEGRIVAAVQEERFSRRKHDPDLPVQAIAHCLEAGDVAPGDLEAVVFYERPLTTFVRILRTQFVAGPRGWRSFQEAMPQWAKHKLWVGYEIDRALRRLGHRVPGRVQYLDHHLSHAASAFYPSPFETAAVLTFDGVGEWATASIGVGRGSEVALRQQLDFPDSIGLLYSAFTSYCGFRVNSGEYKLMGLAPYGEPRFVDDIVGEVVDLRDDGSIRLDQRYFDFVSGRSMTSARFHERFGGPPRIPESELDQRHCDLAASIQEVTERIVLRMARTAAALTGERRACLAGGVALNCVANARLLAEGPFDEIWVQPAAGDAGGALGAASYGWHQILGHVRTPSPGDAMQGALLGPSYDDGSIGRWLDEQGAPAERLGTSDRARAIARLLADGATVGVLQGRAEFGPRSLGNRSILADPRDQDIQRRLNLQVKQRESFRPFAPAVLASEADRWFDVDGGDLPYMLVTAPVARRASVILALAPLRSASGRTRCAARSRESPTWTGRPACRPWTKRGRRCCTRSCRSSTRSPAVRCS